MAKCIVKLQNQLAQAICDDSFTRNNQIQY